MTIFGEVKTETATFSEEKNWAKKRILKAREKAVDAGFSYMGHVFQIDDRSLDTFARMMIGLQAGEVNPSGGKWWDVDNNDVPMTDAELAAFFKGAGRYAQKLRNHTHDLKVAVVAAVDQAALDAIDIDTGWPAQ